MVDISSSGSGEGPGRVTARPTLQRAFQAQDLPIRSIDFYYPEFQAANALIFRDKSKICFLESSNEAILVHKLA